jgi:DNA-binding transcriptional MerR regulator
MKRKSRLLRETLRTGDVAEMCEVSKDTIRLWEAAGLIPTAERGANRYREWSRDDIARVVEILAKRKKTSGG